MKQIRDFILTGCLFILFQTTFSQGVTIGNNTPPDPAAILDLQSTQHGFLLPRMTQTERDAIANPPDELCRFTIRPINVWKPFS